MAKKTDLYEALAQATTPEEVQAVLERHEKLVLSSYGLRVLGWAWERNDPRAPYAYSSFRDRAPKAAGVIELWAKA